MGLLLLLLSQQQSHLLALRRHPALMGSLQHTDRFLEHGTLLCSVSQQPNAHAAIDRLLLRVPLPHAIHAVFERRHIQHHIAQVRQGSSLSPLSPRVDRSMLGSPRFSALTSAIPTDRASNGWKKSRLTGRGARAGIEGDCTLTQREGRWHGRLHWRTRQQRGGEGHRGENKAVR